MGAWEDSKKNSKDTPIDDMRDLFGGALQLSPEMASIVSGAYGIIAPKITEKVEDVSYNVLKSNLGEPRARQYASALGWATILSKDIGNVYSTGKKHYQSNEKLKSDFSSVLQAGEKKESFGHLAKHNEVALVEKKRLMTSLNKGVFSLASGLMTTVPQAIMKQMRSEINDAKNNKLNKRDAKLLEPEKEALEAAEKSYKDELKAAKKDSSYRKEALSSLNNDTGYNFSNFGDDKKYKAINERTSEIIEEKFEGVKEALEKQREEYKNKEKEYTGDKSELEKRYKNWEEIANPAMALGQEMATAAINKKSRNISKQATAFDKIKKLRDSLWDDPESKKVDGKNIKDYVYSIFEQHQEDMGQGGIAKRYHEQFDYAVDKITTAITDGEMSPMALVNLVGERKIVKDKGKAIATREDVKAQIATQIKKLPAHFPVDPDTFLSEAPITIDDIKATIDGLSGIEKHFYISLMPEEVALKAGVEKDDYKVSVSEVKLHHGEMLAKGVLDMASKSDAQLKDELHFDEKEIKMIRELAPKAKEGDFKAAEEAKGKLGKHGIDSILLQDKELWQDMVGKNTHLGDVYHTANDKLWTEREDEAKAEKEHIEDKKKHDDKEDKLDKKEHKAGDDVGDDISSKEAANDSFDNDDDISPDSKVSRVKHHKKAFEQDNAVGF